MSDELSKHVFEAVFSEASQDKEKAFLSEILQMIIDEKFNSANEKLMHSKLILSHQKSLFKNSVNKHHLMSRQLEWTNHGVRETFRFWSKEQKESYMKQANELAKDLLEFTPFVSFGFGSVLCFMRDNDFIDHDDDMDLIIALEPTSFTVAKKRLEEFLKDLGYVCHGNNMSHFGVNRGVGSGPGTDVFIGFREEEKVSWFPSKRGGLDFSDVFPVQKVKFFGQEIPIPAKPNEYLQATYGSDWMKPISNWNHPWDASQYAEFIENS